MKKEYKIIYAEKREEFEKLVNEALSEGWEFSGNLIINNVNTWDNGDFDEHLQFSRIDTFYYREMMKEEENKQYLYRTISASSSERFLELLKKAFDEGWKLTENKIYQNENIIEIEVTREQTEEEKELEEAKR